MIFKSIFTNICIKTLSSFLYIKNTIRTYLFNVIKIYSINSGKKYNLYTKYVLYKFIYNYALSLNNIYLIGPYMRNNIIHLLKTWDNNISLIKLELFKNNSSKDIIFENLKMLDVIGKLNNIDHDINDNIMAKKCIITDVSLQNKDGKCSIKNIIEHYSDKSKKYDHTIKNILMIKNINHTMDDTIEIRYIHNLKRQHQKYILRDIYNDHICDLYNIK